MSEALATALEYLDADPLRNIALRKFLRLYKVERIALHHNAMGFVDGVLCIFPSAQFGYDAKHYPDAQRTTLIRHDHLDVGIALLAELPQDAYLVFKLWNDDLIPALNERYHLQRACSFISLTQAQDRTFTQTIDDVLITSHLPEDSIALLRDSYSIAELHQYFEDAQTRCYALRDCDNHILSAAISYANEHRLHEIAALFTPSQHRRKGYAQRIVSAAIAHIGSMGKQLRYQVRDDNLASLNLAKSIGLSPFVELTHWTAQERT